MSTPAPQFLALGETMALVTPAHAQPLADADEVRLDIGGAESNVAMHAAALGVPSAWIGAVGDDALGRRVLRAIAAAGVDTRWAHVDPAAPTGVYFKDPGHGVLYYRRGSAASRMGPESVAGIPLEQAAVVHVSGITPALSDSCAALIDAVVDRVGASAALLSFDVNHRAALWAPGAAGPALLASARRADVVLVGLDEAHALWGCDAPAAVRALLPEPQTLVVKDGDVGATEFDRDGAQDRETFVPAIPTAVVEAVGAGDAFAAGYLAALLRGRPAPERLRAGHERAHLVLQSTSDVVA